MGRKFFLATLALAALGCSSPLPEWDEIHSEAEDDTTRPLTGAVVYTDSREADVAEGERATSSIEDIVAVTGEVYPLTTLELDSLQFVDRDDRLVDVPNELAGSWLIQTANNDADSTPGESQFLRFWATRNVTVFVAHDRRIADKPAWLSGWASHGQALRAVEEGETRIFDLFSQDFAAGEIVLGSNVDEPADASMYSVVVVEAAP